MKYLLILFLALPAFGAGRNYQPRVAFTNSLSGSGGGGGNGLLTGLIAYWKMEEATGSTREDWHSGNLDAFDLSANVEMNAGGKLNNGATNNTGLNVRLTNSSSTLNFTGSNPFSVSAWVKPIDISNNRVICGDWGADNSWILFEVGGVYQMRIRNGANSANYTASSTVTLSAGTWYHVAAGFDGTVGWIQVNNETRVTTATTDGLRNNTSDAFCIFNYGNGAGGFTGVIDEFGVWGLSLSTTKVTALYNSGNALAPESFD